MFNKRGVVSIVLSLALTARLEAVRAELTAGRAALCFQARASLESRTAEVESEMSRLRSAHTAELSEMREAHNRELVEVRHAVPSGGRRGVPVSYFCSASGA